MEEIMETCPHCGSQEYEQQSIVNGVCTCCKCHTKWTPKREEIPKQYKTEEEVITMICNTLEENLIKNMMDTTDFRELMEKITKEFLKRYPEEKKSRLILL